MKLPLEIFLSILICIAFLPVSSAKNNNQEDLLKRARSYTFKKKYAQADQLYESIVPKMKKQFGSNSKEVNAIYFQWGKNCQANGQHSKAIRLFRNLVSDKTATSGSAHVYELMATSYLELKDYNQAIKSLQNSMNLDGTFKFRKIHYLTKLAKAYELNLDYVRAEQSWKQALKLADVDLGSRKDYIKSAQKHPLGPKHFLEESIDSNILELVDSLHGLGAFYSRRGKYVKAEPYLKRAKSVEDVWVPLPFKKPKLFYDYSKVLKELNKNELAKKVNAEGQKIQIALEKSRKNSLK